jgi:hypothetical protein
MAATRTRKTTKTTTPDVMPQTFETIAISDICTQNGLSEQTFRLALMEFQPDDFDSVKAIPVTVAEQVLATITATSKALPQNLETPENLTPQELQPSQETAADEPQKPQNSSIATSSPKAISNPATGQNIPAALSEFIAKSQEDIELFDLVQVYRNEQIIQNTQTRDSELVMQLREQRLESRAMVFEQLRELNSRQPIAPELPELPTALSDEIGSLANELGKKLAA